MSCNNQNLHNKDDKSNHNTSIRNETIENQEIHSKNVVQEVLSKTVAISMLDKNRQTLSFGSGFIIDKGVIVTNLHVIEDASFGFVEFEGNKYDIEGYISVDQENDLVLLKVPIEKEGIKIHEGNIYSGEKVFVAGNPIGLPQTISDGIISNPERKLSNKKLIQITAPISPGSSGGPVTNQNGELIGVACGTLIEGQNLNFAIPVEYLKVLINNAGEITQLNISKAKKTLSTYDDNKYANWIKIRKISTIDVTDGSKYILCFSIYNKTQYVINNVKIMLIAYDNEGIPTDYKTYSFFPNGIQPGLAKEVERLYPRNKYIEEPAHGRVEFRILSYQISE